MFASTDLARRIEQAERELTLGFAHALRLRRPSQVRTLEVSGGAAVYCGPGMPTNKVIGVGFGDLPSDAELDRIEALFFEAGAPVQFELATLADPDLAGRLTRRGYALVNFENVSGVSLTTGAALPPGPPELAIRLDHGSELDAWIAAVSDGFGTPDGAGVASHESYTRESLADLFAALADVPGLQRYVARWNGEVAGGASLRTGEGVAQLCGAATVPAWRRRGIQTAMLRRRLADAGAAGCDLAVVTTQPGSKSQENVHRQGFSLLYTRAILVRPAT